MDTTFCPSREQLAAMASGQLEGPVAQELASHVSGCQHCVSVLQSLSGQTDPTKALPGGPAIADTGPVDFAAAGDAPLTSDTGNWSDPVRETSVGAPGAQPSSQSESTVENTVENTASSNSPAYVLGDYEVIERLGAGGMGEVYKAVHRRMDRVVAMKVLPQEALGTPAAVERFQREVKAAAKLVHPNIVAAYDAGEQDGLHYLVMEFVDGSDLCDMVDQSGPMSMDQVLDYTIQAARGLEHAHKKGIIHRDVKPANLILDAEGVVKVLDMGLAVIQAVEAVDDSPAGQRVTQTGMIIGTAAYMAPEQAQDMKRADHRADIYSLGCSLYFLLTGRDMYEADTFLSMLLAHREEPIPPLRALLPDLPQQLDNIYHGMVAKSIHERYQAMGEVIADLEMLQAQLKNPQAAAPQHADPYQQAAMADTVPSDVAKVSRGSLVDTIVELGLMTGDQVRHVLSTLPERPGNDDELAQILVHGGHISVYQSAVLTQGDPNELVFGDYLLIEMLAEHEGRALFECRHRVSGDRAAIKIYARDAGDYSRLLAASKLEHPNLVEVLAVGQTEGCDYLVSPFYNTGEISKRIRADGPMRLRDALRAVLAIADPLSVAHEQGVPHGNVSPANVLIGDRDVLKLSDLGWSTYRPPASMETTEAKDASRIDPAEIDYTAPELLDGHSTPNAKSDIYGLGGILYYLATGTTIRLKKSLVDEEDPIPKLTRMVDGAPKVLDHVFERMVAKDKDKRFGSVREVIAALQGVLDPGKLSTELKKIAAPPKPKRTKPEVKVPFWKTDVGSTSIIGTTLLVLLMGGVAAYHLLVEPVTVMAWVKALIVTATGVGVWMSRRFLGLYCTGMPLVATPVFALIWAAYYWFLGLPKYDLMGNLCHHVIGIVTTIAVPELFGFMGFAAVSGLLFGIGGVRGSAFMASGTYYPLLAVALWASGYSIQEEDKGITRFPRDNQLERLIESGQLDRAIDYCTYEIETKGYDTGPNRYQRGRCHLLVGNTDEALADFDRCAELSPGYYETHMMRGNTYKKRGEFDKALKDYDRALAINPESRGVHGGRGEARFELGNYDGAVSDMNIAIEFDPSNAYNYLNRAKAYEKLGKTEEAEADRARAKRLLEAAIDETG